MSEKLELVQGYCFKCSNGMQWETGKPCPCGGKCEQHFNGSLVQDALDAFRKMWSEIS